MRKIKSKAAKSLVSLMALLVLSVMTACSDETKTAPRTDDQGVEMETHVSKLSAEDKEIFAKEQVKVKGRYFVRQGKRWNLHGSHTWNNVHAFDGDRLNLGHLVSNCHRIWTNETGRVDNRGSRFGTGRVMTVDNLQWKKRQGKFDLEKPNPEYYERLQALAKQARENDKVIAIVLFDGAYNRFFGPTGWDFHIPSIPKKKRSKGGAERGLSRSFQGALE